MQNNIKKKHLEKYAKYNIFVYQTYNMHMTCQNGVVTSNSQEKSSLFGRFLTSKSIVLCILANKSPQASSLSHK